MGIATLQCSFSGTPPRALELALMPQVKGVVPNKTALTSEPSHKDRGPLAKPHF